MSTRRPGAHERVYARLLMLYPPNHRRDWGSQMAQLFRDRLRDEGGGWRSVLVWGHVASDLVKTVFVERLEVTSMDNLKHNWWAIVAPLLAGGAVLLGFGNMVTDDGGEFWMRALAFGITVALALAVVAGLWLRRSGRPVGSLVVGLATLPGSLLVVFFWFPPVAAMGILSLVVSIRAFMDWESRRRAALAQPATG